MKPQDHSDTTLLVWSDWLEENGEEQKAYDLREEIANPPAMKTNQESRLSIGVGGIGDNRAGGFNSIDVGGFSVGDGCNEGLLT